MNGTLIQKCSMPQLQFLKPFYSFCLPQALVGKACNRTRTAWHTPATSQVCKISHAVYTTLFSNNNLYLSVGIHSRPQNASH